MLLAIVGCSHGDLSSQPELPPQTPMNAPRLHPKIDFGHWEKVFPIETFQKSSGPRQFASTKKGSPLDLWKPHGEIITSPAHRCAIELVRKQNAQSQEMADN
jgi:hypothetical protein